MYSKHLDEEIFFQCLIYRVLVISSVLVFHLNLHGILFIIHYYLMVRAATLLCKLIG